MSHHQFYERFVIPLHEALSFLLQRASTMSSPSTPLNSHFRHSSVAVGVAVTAVAGVAIAAIIYNRRSPFSKRRRKRNPLTLKQWREAFHPESGRLNDPHKILKKIRFGGIDPSIRSEAWLFLLGFYELDSSLLEREAEKQRKREVYRDLKSQCKLLRERNLEESSEGSERVGIGSEDSDASVEPRKVSVKKEVLEVDDSVSMKSVSEDESGDDDCKEESLKASTMHAVKRVGNAETEGTEFKAPEDFLTWQRIIRLDAVRMNAEWVPYSPSQASVSQKAAWELALSVGLKDDEHLEPCRQHHAARLVSILEAYSLYDPEIGYCQGMSDLLSPFVALFDEDFEAFWCFVHFMNSARHNFRTDEVGIRRQLNKISNIFRAGDPALYSHLQRIQAQDCYFVYRMVVVLLRRELTFEQTISLWEVIWAEKKDVALGHTRKSSSWKRRKKCLMTDDLILFVIAAAVQQKRKFIIDKCRGLDEILRECNSMAGRLDIWTLLDEGRELLAAVHGRIPD